jgi:hypothetical protein
VIKEVPMQLWAGFVGVQVDEKTGALTPKIGWLARIADEDDDKLTHLKEMNRHGKLSYSYFHENDTLPGILAKMERINRLELNFNSYPVNIPAWVDNINIDKLKVRGHISEAEEAQLRQRFPNAEIDKFQMLDFKPEEVTDTLDIELEGIAVYDMYDIRRVLE